MNGSSRSIEDAVLERRAPPAAFELRIGGRALRVESFRGTEGMSTLFRFDVVVWTELDPREVEASTIARPATLAIHGQDEAPRIIQGIISRCAHRRHDRATDLHEYQLRLVPRMWLLRKRVRSRIFQDMALPSIVGVVLRELGVHFRFDLRRTPPLRAYCVQHQESDYDFVTRLCAEEGIFFLFEAPLVSAPRDADTAVGSPDDAAASELVVFGDVPQMYPAVIGGSEQGPMSIGSRAAAIDSIRQIAAGIVASGAPTLSFRPASGMATNEEHVLSLTSTRAVKPTSLELRDWSFLHPTLGLRAKALMAADVGEAPVSTARVASVPPPSLRVSGEAKASPLDAGLLEVYTHHGEYEEPDVQRESAAIALEQVRRRARKYEGESTSPRLAAGHRFRLDGHPTLELDREYVVTSVRHTGRIPESRRDGRATSGPVYQNLFAAVPSAFVFRPPRPARMHQQVLESAVVVGPANEEIYVDEYGRVKVQFHWDREGLRDEHSSCWIRVLQPWAGTGFGVQFIPRVGMEVMVSFLGGDEDRPVIMGCAHNQTHPTPFRLPMSKSMSGIRTRSTPNAEGYNELSFEDAAGGEIVHLRAQRNLDVDVERDQRVGILGNSRTLVGEEHTLEVGGSRSATVRGHDTRGIEGSSIERVAGDARSTVGGTRDTQIAGRVRNTMAGESTHNRGDHHALVEGTSSTSVGTDRREGYLGFFVKGEEVHEATRRITLRSDEGLVLACGDSSITLNKDGIVLQADKVTVAGRKSVTLLGHGPALELTDKVDVCSESIHLYARGASVELCDETARVEAAQIDMGTDPATATIQAPADPEKTKKFRWKLVDADRAPLANRPYRLMTQGMRKKGTTDGEGVIALDVPKEATSVDLTIWTGEYPAGARNQYTMSLEALPPSTSVHGAALRLTNLGYYCGPSVDEMTPELSSALAAFQYDHDLKPTGDVDGPTIAKLDDVHRTA